MMKLGENALYYEKEKSYNGRRNNNNVKGSSAAAGSRGEQRKICGLVCRTEIYIAAGRGRGVAAGGRPPLHKIAAVIFGQRADPNYIIVHRLAGSRVAQPYLPLAPRPATCTLIKLALFIRLRRRRRPFEKQYIIYIIYMYTHYYYRYTQLKLGRRTRFPPSSLTRL